MVLSEQIVNLTTQEDLSDKEFVEKLITSSEVGLALTVKRLSSEVSVIADEIQRVLYEEFENETKEIINKLNSQTQDKLLESMGLTKDILKTLSDPMNIPFTKNKSKKDFN